MKKTILFLSVIIFFSQFSSARQVGVYCYMAQSGTEVAQDANIRARITYTSDGTALLEVTNLTPRVVYVDRANSFSYVNAMSVPLYTASTNTESHTYSRGVVEGDDEHRHVKWIEGESHTNSITVTDQRIMPIAPYGTAVAYAWHRLPSLLRRDVIWPGHQGGILSNGHIGHFVDTGQKFRKGDVRHYSADNTPLLLMADIQYSFSEMDYASANRLRMADHVATVAIGSTQGVESNGLLNASYLPLAAAQPCFAFRSGAAFTMVEFGCAFGAVALVAPLIMLKSASSTDFPDYPF